MKLFLTSFDTNLQQTPEINIYSTIFLADTSACKSWYQIFSFICNLSLYMQKQ